MARDSKIKLPYSGRFHYAKIRKFEETIIFVPFFGGKPLHLQRHVKFVNELGYDAVTFALSYHSKTILTKIPWSLRTHQWGLKHRWADEIEDILRLVSGPKIIFAFSNPCSCSLEAIARSNDLYNVKAMICDSGPFVDMWTCNWNLLTHEFGIKNKLWRTYLNIIFKGFWSYSHEKTVYESLHNIKSGFPILSIRGWEDNLVPLKAIEKAFKNQDHLHLEVLNLPEGGHLNGLKDFKDQYTPRVEDFLTHQSQQI